MRDVKRHTLEVKEQFESESSCSHSVKSHTHTGNLVSIHRATKTINHSVHSPLSFKLSYFTLFIIFQFDIVLLLSVLRLNLPQSGVIKIVGGLKWRKIELAISCYG